MRAGAIAVGFSLLAGCNCSPAPELSVDVRTDLVPGVEFDEVRVELDAEPAPALQARAGDDFANGLRVAEFSSVQAGLRRLDVALTEDGVVILERRVHVRIEGSQIVLVVLARDCRGVMCPGSGDAIELTECLGGRCVSPDCSGDDPDPMVCGVPECAADEDCRSSTPCVSPGCFNGICLELPRTGGCGLRETCVPGRGCIASPRPDDGGVIEDGGECSPSTCVAGPCETASCVAGVCERSTRCADGEFCCAGDVCAVDCSTSCEGVPAGTTCREARGACDLAETCDGASGVCPPDERRPDGLECRAAAGECDVADTCAGSDECSADAFAPTGTSCSGGSCNGLGTCLSGCTPGSPCSTGEPCELGTIDCAGGTPRCVASGPAPATTVCRSVAGPCDVEERCTGSSTTCPGDGFASGSAECRGSSGPCDVAELCPGSGPDCPGDGLRPSGFECRAAAGACDRPEACDGGSAGCPGNDFRTGVCRGGSGPCDPDELCTGSSPDCPGDVVLAGGTVCRGSAGPCDIVEICNGSSGGCPADFFLPGGTVCATEGGDCEANDVCTGTSAACPESFAPAGTICRGPSGPCNLADACSGSSATCPADRVAPDGTTCNTRCGEEMCLGGACVGGMICGAGERCGCDEFCVCSTCACL